MVAGQQTELITFVSGDTRYVFFPGGDVKEFTHRHDMINQFVGTPMEGSANNIYLRVQDGEEVRVYPLLGYASESKVSAAEEGLIYEGCVLGIRYKVVFTFKEDSIWFWHVELYGNGQNVQLVYGQDVGVGDRGGIRTNELYLSQYLDHFIDERDGSYTVCSRQNQSQGGCFPYLQQGCLDQRLAGYCTDAMDFYGKEYRKTQRIEALYREPPKKKYQYELSYIGLWTDWLSLDQTVQATFYGMFIGHMEQAVKGPLSMEKIRSAYEAVDWDAFEGKPVQMVRRSPLFGGAYASPEMTEEEINVWFPERLMEEREGEALLSFFKPDHTHVVFQKKELLVERPHGNIITSLPEDQRIRRDLMTSTNFMYGLFHAQTAIGNTDSNRLLSANRGLLNIQKYTGQRLWVKLGDTYQVLTLPAAYEAALNYSRWYYKIQEDMVIVDAVALAHTPRMMLNVRSVSGKTYEFLITSQLSMGNGEFNEDMNVEVSGSRVVVTPREGAAILNYYQLAYAFEFPEDAVISDDAVFYEDHKTRNGTLLTAMVSASSFSLTMSGTLDGQWHEDPEAVGQGAAKDRAELWKELPQQELGKYLVFYEGFRRGFHLSVTEGTAAETMVRPLEKLNILATWYLHNAFVHFHAPRGLEQCSGAAWGTRDVCQGPMELFLATGHFRLARETLLAVYSHQNVDTKEWPQWFMFDQYPYMAGDCHGDVVFWPLKCLGDYLEYTGDTSILDEEVPFRHTDGSVAKSESLLAHVKLALEAVGERFLGDSALISYAGGDWDDTLQPADPRMKERLISAWTQALAYQSLGSLAAGMKKAQDPTHLACAKELEGIVDDIKRDFEKYLIKDGVIAGFAYREEDGSFSYMLHPSDNKTGIHYRLLPLTRSIISHLADEDQAKKNIAVIEEHLTFPDGVRLMDRPAGYDGGVSRFFQRAEQAANVGREISLQYVHAHIRYIEAMSVYGDGARAFEGLMKIVPINIRDTVANAKLRQSNVYFSSSEGDFADRYEYAREFDRLKDGSVEVKGGWRIYSSGPGIFLVRLLGNMLGLRDKTAVLELDPVLPRELTGLVLTYAIGGQPVRLCYHVGAKGAGVEKIVCNGQELTFTYTYTANPYRAGGAVIDKSYLLDIVKSDPMIHVYIF